jgi:cytosine/adenosine deaminase-related metal-dependent hydrolase
MFTNAHTHLELTWAKACLPPITGDSFTNWIIGTFGGAVRTLGDQRMAAYRKAAEDGIQMLIDAGITEVGDISTSGMSIEPLLDSGLKGIVYVEVIGVTKAMGDEYMTRAIALIEQYRPLERNGMRIGLTLHTPYSVTPPTWERGLEYARQEALPLCIHAAESTEEHEWFMHGRGVFTETFARAGADFASPGMSPIRYLDETGALALKPLLAHVVQVDEDDIARIARSGSAVVHCPRSNIRLRCGRMPLERFLAAGVNVYLGTDSLASSPSLDVRDEIEFAAALHWDKVSPQEIEALAQKTLVV